MNRSTPASTAVLLFSLIALPCEAVEITQAVRPAQEPCDDRLTGYPPAPPEMLDCAVRSCVTNCMDPDCRRLIEPLRQAARTRDASEILVRAALEYYVLQHPELRPSYTPPLAFPSGSFAQALADLAVTGQAAYGTFRRLSPREADLTLPLQRRLQATFPSHVRVPSDVSGAIKQALHRSYQVAWALRGPTPYRRAYREPLGWIAVAGEDDAPHRPVNVPPAPFPQYNLTVRVNTIDVVTRYVVASRSITDDHPADLTAIPPDRPLPLIVGDIVLFIHGHSSSLEEAMPLAGPLMEQGDARGRPVTLIAMDLPTNGYSSMVDHTSVAAPEASLWNRGYPILDFIENFIVGFVDQLEVQQPGITGQIVGVIGGSLGGNMTLRLGRRDPAVHPWLHSVVSWSPASTGLSWARAVLGPAPAGRFYDFIKHEGKGRSYGSMVESELTNGTAHDSLHWFFYAKFGATKTGRIGQAEHWFSESWLCKESAKKASHRGVYEMYNATFRRWHWRVAHEQLIYSHWDSDNPDSSVDPGPRYNPAAGPARYEQIRARVLLAIGHDDDIPPMRIWLETKALAEAMTMVRGTTLFLEGTGHAMHVEKPVFFSSQILKFLFETPPPPFPYFLVPGATF